MFVNYRNPHVLSLKLLEFGVIRVLLPFKLRYLVFGYLCEYNIIGVLNLNVNITDRV